MRTVIEFPEFIRKAEKEFDDVEREEIVFLLSKNPKTGNKLENFGGIRKLVDLEWEKETRNTTYIFIREPTIFH